MARAVATPFHATDVRRPADAPRSFEQSLRDVVRDSPYLTISVVVHALLLALFATAPAEVPPTAPPTILSGVESAVDPPPPPPPPVTVPLQAPPLANLPPTVDPPSAAVAPSADAPPADRSFGVAGDSPATSAALLGVGGGPPPGHGPGGSGHIGTGRGTEGPARFDAAVHRALEWLAHHQSPDGLWSAAEFDRQCGAQGDDTTCDGPGSPQYDVGVTGLSLLAFLGAGQTHRAGSYRRCVNAGLAALVRGQGPDGNFGLPGNPQHTYDHALATLAVTEAYLASGDPQLRAPAQAGVRYLQQVRSPGSGWRYASFHPAMATHPADTSVTGWALLALITARDADLEVEPAAVADGLALIEELTDPRTGRTGYLERGQRPAREPGADAVWPAAESESMTAVAVLCRIFADPTLSAPGALDAVRKGAELIAALPPVWDDDSPGRRDFYAWYYGTFALFQVGGRAWARWQEAIERSVIAHQHVEGERSGSWDPQVDPWGSAGGRVYATALLALTLEVHHRYAAVLGGTARTVEERLRR